MSFRQNDTKKGTNSTLPGVKISRGMTMKKILTFILLASLTAGVFALPNLLKKEQFGANSIDNLEIDLSSEDIDFKETYDSSAIEVEIYCNNKKYAPEVSVSGSTLYIESQKRSFGFFEAIDNPTGFRCTVIVYVPQKKDFEEIVIGTSSGDINVHRVLSAKSIISLKASSGDISSEKGLFADTVKASASSGDIELYNIDADDFTVSTSSGDIVIEKFTGGTGDIHSTSGDIDVKDFATEYAEFKSTSGHINVKKLDCDYFDVNSTSGGISIELTNGPSATSSASCTSGDIELYVPMRAKFSVQASCTSGSFRDRFNNNRMNPRGSVTQDYNGGGSLIKIRTTSGDITLDY